MPARKAFHRDGCLTPGLLYRLDIKGDPCLLFLQPRGYEDELASPGGLARPLEVKAGVGLEACGQHLAERGLSAPLTETPFSGPILF